jgi:hypothetical protein
MVVSKALGEIKLNYRIFQRKNPQQADTQEESSS